MLLGLAAVLLLIVAGVLVLLAASLWRLYAALCAHVDASAATVVRTALRGVGATPDDGGYTVSDIGPDDEDLEQARQRALDLTSPVHHPVILKWGDQEG